MISLKKLGELDAIALKLRAVAEQELGNHDVIGTLGYEFLRANKGHRGFDFNIELSQRLHDLDAFTQMIFYE